MATIRALAGGAAALALSVAFSLLAAARPAPQDPPEAPTAQAPPDFARDIQPLLEARCYECHGPKKARGRLRLDRKASALKGGMTGPAVIPGDSENSILVRRLLGLDGEDRMPLDQDPLPEDHIALVRRWIDAGAEWPGSQEMTDATVEADTPGHWAYRAPERPPLPAVSRKDWVRNPIDRFILARLEKEGLSPSPEAPKAALLRRLSLDLIGLPPTLEELDAFLADDRPDAYERQVDRLLASPHYGERWARPWLDLARYADSHGYEKDRLRTMWKYRDWVIDALNADMPFDRFTIEQIAGDMLPEATVDQRIASGFHRNTLLNQEGGIDVEEARWEALLDRVNTTGTVWLGTTIACAQCHNHKYDPFSQRDYFRLLAFFDNVEYSVYGKPGSDRWIQEPTLDLPTPEQAKRREELLAERDALNGKLEAPGEEIDAGLTAWEQAMRAVDEDWTRLVPVAARAEAATLTTRPDGSVLASGKHPGSDEYVVEAELPEGALTGIRLEALPDESLPKGGPGRDYYGNFVLTAFRVELLAPDSGAAATVTFASAKSDDSAGGDVGQLLKRSDEGYGARGGWSIDATRDEERLRRQAVFVPGEPLDVKPGTRARIRLGFEGGNVGQALGCFRLSVTGARDPLAAVALRAKTRAFLGIDDSSRTDEQRAALRSAYRAQVPALKPIRDRLAEVEQALGDLGIVTALVMKEKTSHQRPSTPFRERGAYMSPGDRVYADTPEILPPLPRDQMPNRLGLAHWLVGPENPLTARVTVNRAWEQIFGRGIVETSEDFGTQGAPPSHPELLDWLATEFVRVKWSQKALHRLIVTSSAYRQSAAATPALLEKDPYNRLLARGPRFRLDAEAIRDVMLTASGLLSRKIGGPSVFPPQPDGIWDNPYSNEKWVESEGEDRHRRGLYTFIRRTSPYPSFITFDATSREFCTVRRVRTNTPLQALAALNDEAAFGMARALADRMIAEVQAGAGPPAEVLRTRAAHGFRLCTSRQPTDEETARIVASYEEQAARYAADPAAAAAVAQAEEAGGNVAERAAWTLVANALLNLDETLTK